MYKCEIWVFLRNTYILLIYIVLNSLKDVNMQRITNKKSSISLVAVALTSVI